MRGGVHRRLGRFPMPGDHQDRSGPSAERRVDAAQVRGHVVPQVRGQSGERVHEETRTASVWDEKSRQPAVYLDAPLPAAISALSFCWYSGYVVSAPPLAASIGIPCAFANSPAKGLLPGR